MFAVAVVRLSLDVRRGRALAETIDIIDTLAGLAPDSSLRAARPDARRYAQKSYEALFVSPAEGLLPLSERLAVALFVAELHRDPPSIAHYRALLVEAEGSAFASAISAAAADGLTTGPYGIFPAGPLSAEDATGFSHSADQSVFGDRLAAALDHAHLLIFHPRDANRDAIERLHEAGWSATDIVTLSQLVSFLSFQIRAGAGLRILAQTAEVSQ